MNLSVLAHRHRPLVLAALSITMLYGLASYFSLPAREDPKITVREAVITTLFPGLPAERVERLITRTLEEAVRQVPEVEEIRSRSREGRSVIHVEVHDSYFELDQIWDEVRSKLEGATADLPEGTYAPVLNDDFGDVAVVTAALTAEDFDMAAMFDVAQTIQSRLYDVPHTKRIDMLGAQEERIFVEIDSTRIAQLGVDPEVIFASIRAQNTIRPGGTLDTQGRRFVIRPTGNYGSVEDVAATLVPAGGEIVLPLGELAEVRRGFVDPPQRLAYFNGRPAIIFAIAMDDGIRVLEFAEQVRRTLRGLEQGLPVGYRLDIVTFQAEQVANAVYGVSLNLLQTLAIVLAVAILFLGLRTGLIVGSIVPAAILVTLATMGFFELALERMSLATLIIALGLLVDNGIVVAEDFKRRLEGGDSRDTALTAAGRELALPLLTSSLTTILVFLPLMLADHAAGEYTRSISLVILITLSASWLLAMTVTPQLCHRFIPDPAGGAEAGARWSSDLFEGLASRYRDVLVHLLRRRWLFLAAMVLMLAGAAFLFAQLPSKFFPASDRAQILVYVDLPADATTRETDRQMRSVSTLVMDRERFPFFGSHAAYVGFGGPRFVLSLSPVDPASNVGFMVINVDGAENVQRGIGALRSALREEFPAFEARVTDMFLGPSDSSVIEVQVKGPDADYLLEAAARIKGALADVPGTIDIRSDWDERVTQVTVDVDQARARRAGVTSRDIAVALQTFFSGRVVTEFREGDDLFPLVVRGRQAERSDLAWIQSTTVRSDSTGEPVPIMQVADVALDATWSTIARENLQRTVTVSARNTRRTAEEMAPLLAPALERLREALPYAHTIEFDGVVTESVEGRSALMANTPLVIGIIALLLIAQFNDYRRPLIVFAVIPLIGIGAAVGLFVLGGHLGFMVILGLFALAGIIINHAVVLIDRIDIERAAGDGEDGEALLSACVQRLRPILMSTVTTILGLLPLILGRDPLFYGMAGVIAFGLGVGTVLTLGVVPVLYSLMFRIAPSKRADAA